MLQRAQCGSPDHATRTAGRHQLDLAVLSAWAGDASARVVAMQQLLVAIRREQQRRVQGRGSVRESGSVYPRTVHQCALPRRVSLGRCLASLCHLAEERRDAAATAAAAAAWRSKDGGRCARRARLHLHTFLLRALELLSLAANLPTADDFDARRTIRSRRSPRFLSADVGRSSDARIPLQLGAHLATAWRLPPPLRARGVLTLTHSLPPLHCMLLLSHRSALSSLPHKRFVSSSPPCRGR